MYRVLVADPPWPTVTMSKTMFGDGVERKSDYRLMPIPEIKKFTLPPLAEDCMLFMWRLASMQEGALEVCRAWGFVPHAELVWEKKTAKGKDWFGMGRVVRGAHETCLIGFREGKFRKPAVLNQRSRFSAPYRGHSRKPDEFYEIVERLYPGGPYVELFARRSRPGWRCFGDELPEGKEAP